MANRGIFKRNGMVLFWIVGIGCFALWYFGLTGTRGTFGLFANLTGALLLAFAFSVEDRNRSSRLSVRERLGDFFNPNYLSTVSLNKSMFLAGLILLALSALLSSLKP